MNEIIGQNRKNRYLGSKQKKEFTRLCADCTRAFKLKRINSKVDVSITWVEKNRRRDKDNISAGQKFIFDGLIEAGVLKNDGWKEIGEVSHSFRVDKKNPRIIVRLREVGSEEDLHCDLR